MIYFDNSIYIHVPKTSGSSFEKMCEQRHGLKKMHGIHSSAIDIEPENRNKTIFGLMRHPVLSEYSNYRYHKFSWRGNDSFNFSTWCRWRFGDDKEFANSLGIKQKQIDYGWKFNILPQAGYFCINDGTCIADRIFRFEFETLADTYKEISSITGVNCSIEGFGSMSYGWGKGKENYWDSITDADVEILRRAKAIDFELWEESGKEIRTNFKCPAVKRYQSSRG